MPSKIRKVKKVRLDQLLVERRMVPTVEKARALILKEDVIVETACLDKAGALVPFNADIRLRGEEPPYVSRGGLKLRGALDYFGLDVGDAVVLDVGASTGGFTDCLLQARARKVYALDVGYGQLAWKLRSHPRVVTIERTNIRHYDGSDLDEKPTLAVIDVSFISLKAVLPAVLPLITQDAHLLVLVKPQFEARQDEVEPNGVVRDPAVHKRVIDDICQFCQANHMQVEGTCLSPLLGPAGNKEFFLLLRKKAMNGD